MPQENEGAPGVAEADTAGNPYHWLNQKDTYKPVSERPAQDVEFQNAKSYLQSVSMSSESGVSLYEHMTELVARLLETRPKDALADIEAISAQVKRRRFPADRHVVAQHFTAPSATLESAKNQIALFEAPAADEAQQLLLQQQQQQLQGQEPCEIPDILSLAQLWEWAGVSLGPERTFTLMLSIRHMTQTKPVKSVRFWGKISGTKADYLILEAELRDDVDEADLDPADLAAPAVESASDAAAAAAAAESMAQTVEIDPETGEPRPVLVQVRQTGPKPLPREVGDGANRYVYYVATELGKTWLRLPQVVPELLQASRRIKKLLTGDLERRLQTFPAFPGTEADLLRCQIARISAATVISPAGYYVFDPENDTVDEADMDPTKIIVNPEFETVDNDALGQLNKWVHHIPYILPQGRVTWANPAGDEAAAQRDDASGAEDREDEDEEGADGQNDPEQGPPILSPVTADAELPGAVPAWSVRVCSTLSRPRHSPIALFSNRWPGAATVAYNDKFVNIYVGDGVKAGAYQLPVLPDVQNEWVPEPTEEEEEQAAAEEEATDPTLEEEKAWEEQQRARAEEDASENGSEEGSDAGSEEA
ncbi:hypothetical protein CXG81DRAFT_11583 [Caulochytrium protostelioides]|uniref:Radial spokehead-like protein n=1 Tax=Caulochytrium protostelioides TaxID=1555241 RepID=A0A4P9X8Y7_9FUNG|nr:radial spokehead-like protein [Caulochytrium protostelioides]RKP01784.1 hypothetical protein CXG81DRAFT_11583 [Caulochytrium protostelioides]|eukprot:RKP01784.1 hypothetical protein CXG81DRAFT_11583 [Caulochytrium protostelioides]